MVQLFVVVFNNALEAEGEQICICYASINIRVHGDTKVLGVVGPITLLDVAALVLIPFKVLITDLAGHVVKRIRIQITLVELLNNTHGIIRVTQGADDNRERAVAILIVAGALNTCDRNLDVPVCPVTWIL